MDGEPSINDRTTEAIVTRRADPSETDPLYLVLETVAEAEDVDITDLPPIYERTNTILDTLFSDPPIAEAQVVITFTYNGYRIRIDQEGLITLQKIR